MWPLSYSAEQISRRAVHWIVALCLSLLLTGCSGGDSLVDVQANGLPSVIKSSNDQREYRHLVLENKLEVLLISDAEAETSAASLSHQAQAAAVGFLSPVLCRLTALADRRGLYPFAPCC